MDAGRVPYPTLLISGPGRLEALSLMPACTILAKAVGAFAILCPSLCSLEAVKGVKVVAKVGSKGACAKKRRTRRPTPTFLVP
mgnify:CR=1 FL=1